MMMISYNSCCHYSFAFLIYTPHDFMYNVFKGSLSIFFFFFLWVFEALREDFFFCVFKRRKFSQQDFWENWAKREENFWKLRGKTLSLCWWMNKKSSLAYSMLLTVTKLCSIYLSLSRIHESFQQKSVYERERERAKDKRKKSEKQFQYLFALSNYTIV